MDVLLGNDSAADTAAQHVVKEAIQMQALPREWLAPALPQSRCQRIQHWCCKGLAKRQKAQDSWPNIPADF